MPKKQQPSTYKFLAEFLPEKAGIKWYKYAPSPIGGSWIWDDLGFPPHCASLGIHLPKWILSQTGSQHGHRVQHQGDSNRRQYQLTLWCHQTWQWKIP